MRILAIDQGTTNTKAVVFDESGTILTRAASPLTTEYPHPGWAEQSAEAIWASVAEVVSRCVESVGQPDAIAIANQRETLVVWDSQTSKPIGPAPIWQCRRTAVASARLIAEGHDRFVMDRTGLAINPLFPAGKLAWVLQHVDGARALLAEGRLRAGTVDSWLLWNLTGGAIFATDHSNASRTQLFDTERLEFSGDLAAIFGADVSCLPRPRPSDSLFGTTAARSTDLSEGVPIHAMMGDSHAALYGHGVRTPGPVKATYGTGSSLMTLTPSRVASRYGLSGTIAWTDRAGTAYALEGNITVSAQAAAFMARLLGLPDAATLSALAQAVPDSGGVVFVPALAGLGAPHWNDDARGTVSGMTHATLPAHLARATFEAIAHQVADVFEAMEKDVGHRLERLLADGGASVNEFLMQQQADVLGRVVATNAFEDIGAFGVAAMAASGMGAKLRQPDPLTQFTPHLDIIHQRRMRQNWSDAVAILSRMA